MAARNRPRVPKDENDAHEERELWSKIVTDLKDLTSRSKRAQQLASEIAAAEEKIGDNEPSVKELANLEKLYQEQKQQAEDEHESLSVVLEMNDLLIALRTATEGGDRGGVPQKNRIKRKFGEEGVSADSPSNRNPKMQRSNSAVPTEGLQLQSEVAYRLPKQKNAEGEWIQCIITGIAGEGNKRKYEVQDPEPDEAGGHGKYRASASALIPIPKDSTNLPQYPVGKQVLARYPETTTFYRAEVMGTKRDGTCRLKFEGEEEVGKETEVERRLVLDVGEKK
ncbi:SGF29 tudor-like domain-containing protein [Geopyxis carbonaria]|nr:SGF29 tudor-like domain-containing protein [Geopyxis carbonaria]